MPDTRSLFATVPIELEFPDGMASDIAAVLGGEHESGYSGAGSVSRAPSARSGPRASGLQRRRRRHPTLTGLALDAVATLQGLVQAGGGVRHVAVSRRSSLRIAASTLAGTAARCSVADAPPPAMILPSTACAVLPVNGGSPTSISYSTHPSA